ncbi:MAG: hypothetical protein ABIN18_09905 [Pseudomonadota bacterium]
MLEMDLFASSLFEEAKCFLEKAKHETDEKGKMAYLHAALLIGFSSLEAHINAIAEEKITVHEELSVLEESILLEKEFYLKNGSFTLTDTLKMYRLTERIEFLYSKFSKIPLDKSKSFWEQIKVGLRIRNDLVHPKEQFILSERSIETALEGILSLLDDLYIALYKQHYPALGRRLDSNMDF